MARRYPHRPTVYVNHACAEYTAKAPCIHGQHKPHEMCEFYGPTRPFSVEQATRYVYGTVMAPRGDAEDKRPAIVSHMVATGECVWHAVSEVMNAPMCSCGPCQNPKHWAHAFSLDSRRIMSEVRS